jgi:hypothetical protein
MRHKFSSLLLSFLLPSGRGSIYSLSMASATFFIIAAGNLKSSL